MQTAEKEQSLLNRAQRRARAKTLRLQAKKQQKQDKKRQGKEAKQGG